MCRWIMGNRLDVTFTCLIRNPASHRAIESRRLGNSRRSDGDDWILHGASDFNTGVTCTPI